MYLDMYFEQVEKSFRRIRETQLRAIKEAAGAVAQSLVNRGALLIMDTGHMLRYEAFFRAGGMMAVAPFSYELKLDNPVDQRKAERSGEEQAELERQL
ncbi:MAG: SIS domain-containing protein, partial [Candidatus Hydrogenedentes bacterium]|nr:SIS domain-containing protein [Candidatus Hydrogenedentota bacterium]